MSVSVSNISNIYSYSGLTINVTRLHHQELTNYYLHLKEFKKSLGENAEDDYWKEFIRPLKRYQFQLCAAPLAFNYPKECQPDSLKYIKEHLSKCKQLYPDYEISALKLFEDFMNISKSSQNPLHNFIRKDKITLLVKEHYLISCINDYLRKTNQINNFEIILASQLRNTKCYENLVIVGMINWFSDYEYIFTAPRCKSIDIVQFALGRDKQKFTSAFIDSIELVLPYIQVSNIYVDNNADNDIKSSTNNQTVNNDGADNYKFSLDKIDSDELLPPSVNINEIVKKHSFASYTNNEDVEARLFLLENYTAAFLDIDSKQIVVDLEQKGQLQVNKICVDEIKQGMYIILRTNGGGDYIVTVADKILGEQVHEVRKLQQYWKKLLKQKIQETSYESVSLNLARYGCVLAKNKQNLRNWVSSRSIRPENDKDFNAILRFVGLEDRLKEFNDAASIIRSAHRKAGKRIRSLLLERIPNYNLRNLEQQGTMDFELAEDSGGSMTAFRVIDISTETAFITSSKIANHFIIESDIINA
ncbi:hypothetical protein CAL7716_057970 [Calothrix sp. PCC 7716]|nr:hypothetical protein CAL7716_057970 [Calothrix sp. PCC 7716]